MSMTFIIHHQISNKGIDMDSDYSAITVAFSYRVDFDPQGQNQPVREE